MKRHFYRLMVPAVFLLSPVVSAQEAEIMTDTAQDGTPDFMGSAEPERRPGEVPAMFRDDSLLDENHSNQELGINVYTAPSISKIFDQLDNLPSIPEEYVLRNRPEKIPMHAGALALEMGYLLADGFIAVRSGHMNDIKPIALALSRYGNALGVGEKMNSHSAGLLEHAEKGQLAEFKRILTSTQSDVNAELTSLRDPALWGAGCAHLRHPQQLSAKNSTRKKPAPFSMQMLPSISAKCWMVWIREPLAASRLNRCAFCCAKWLS